MQTSLLHDLVVPIIHDQFQKSDNRYLLDSASHPCQYPSKHQSKCRVSSNQKKRSRKADSNSETTARLGTNISETIKRKLSLGARILQVGGVEKVFMKYFSMIEGEKLLKVCHCYLSTTSGPLAGLLFISTEKVVILVKNIKCVSQSQNVEKPTQKYITIVTMDNFDFWFMGVFKYQKTIKYLEQAISQV
ncbi:GEM-like protein 4 [Vicia villosa]|uniref:GEM-like protein 4 n=1 Tax=Vicia villosa TaxID=3911 RepID=UPI00273BB1FA|nr:GEM-like protein 4 [Vicia villosa]